MDSLGISFEGNHATIKMAKGAFNILKTKLIDKVKSGSKSSVVAMVHIYSIIQFGNVSVVILVA